MWPGFISQPFDLVIVALFAFLVLGPERFPAVARTASRWLHETKGVLHSLTADSDRDPTDAGPTLGSEPYHAADASPTRQQELDTIC
jgi:Sec-independent protein translocase protein TatA